MAVFYQWRGPRKTKVIRLAVMDMWKPFRNATRACAPQAAIVFDKFHLLSHLSNALDDVRKTEYVRLSSKDRGYITRCTHRTSISACCRGRKSASFWMRRRGCCYGCSTRWSV